MSKRSTKPMDNTPTPRPRRRMRRKLPEDSDYGFSFKNPLVTLVTGAVLFFGGGAFLIAIYTSTGQVAGKGKLGAGGVIFGLLLMVEGTIRWIRSRKKRRWL